MNPLNWLSARHGRPDPRLRRRCAALPAPAALDERPLEARRLVVVDLETSGLDTRRDQVLSIGAVVIEDGAIDFAQQFECTLQQDDHKVSASVLIHGLAPSEIAAGQDPAEALLGFMAFLGDSPLLAFHAGFDQRMLDRALRQTLGLRLRHPVLDVAELAPMLCPRAEIRQGGLDDWIRHFGLRVHQRHHASADALATAQIALILFNRARKLQIHSLKTLEERLAGWRRRQQATGL